MFSRTSKPSSKSRSSDAVKKSRPPLEIVLRALSTGRTLDLAGLLYGMDEDGDVGLAMEVRGKESIVGDRLTVGQLTKLANALSEEQLIDIAFDTALNQREEL